MMKKLLLTTVLGTIVLTACSNLNVGNMVDVGGSLFKAATLSDQEMHAIGLATTQKYDAESKVADSKSKYAQRLNKLTRNLKTYEGKQLSYKVYLSQEVNAFVTPSGDVRVYSGLMDKMTDDELVFVLGHEIGHFVKQHSKGRVRTQYLSIAAQQAAGLSSNALLASLSQSQLGELAKGVVNAQYSQANEYEADAYGLKVLKETNRNPQAAVTALRKLATLSESGGLAQALLGSHPDSSKRANRIEKQIASGK